MSDALCFLGGFCSSQYYLALALHFAFASRFAEVYALPWWQYIFTFQIVTLLEQVAFNIGSDKQCL